jgi:histidyl-tRNA synthetase
VKGQPQLLKGTRDFLPQRMILRQYVTGVLRDTFERFGFEPLDTPAIEYAETLEGKFGEEADKLIYKFEDRGGRMVGLRYDLTVPLSRVVAMYPDLVKPFKRYQIAPVWRAEKPQRGRYREFWQCDVDTVGTSSMMADAEIVQLTVQTLTALGFKQFTVKINDRKALTALCEYAGVPQDESAGVYRALDKLEKIGVEAVKEELLDVGLHREAVEKLIDLVYMQVEGDASLERIKELLAPFPRGVEGLAELQQLLVHLQAMGVDPTRYQIDLSMVRGLDYYTGPIFETVVQEPKIGSITGGGRYDKLIGLLGSRDVPATGTSLGLERLVDVIENLNMAPDFVNQTITRVLVTVFSLETLSASMEIASRLRNEGVNTEVYLGTDRLGNQLRYASRKGIPFVAIVGPDEIARGEVVLKNLATEEQQSVSVAGLPALVALEATP